MKNKAALVPLAVFALIVGLVAIPLLKGKDPSVVPSVMIGRTAPSFSLPPALENAKGFDARDLKSTGGPSLVNFFSSWCLTCGAEHKLLAHIAHDEGVTVYGIDYKDKKADIAAWLGRHGNPYRAIGFDADGRAAIDWGVYGVPETFVVDRTGVIKFRYVGPLTEEDYNAQIKPVLEAAGK